ncbi:class A beta-lactamase [Silvibacterium acidisoli]|uniref:class A beta-lactamase n=1 Tax=Acidobacteriaceae bacterium ZG23-2 TaxID=2883246 RepID=UPI00406D2DB9
MHTISFNRRQALAAIGAAALTPYFAFGSIRTQGIEEELAAIEKSSGGRLGVAVLETATGERAGYRADERFPMCSTFKALAASAVLHRVDEGRESLDRKVKFGREALIEYSPATEKFAGGDGMALREICKAGITLSDNTAGNLMLEAIGGPAALTAFLRSTGDSVSRLDRTEPTLNDTVPGDPRDTTSPNAVLATWKKLVLSDVLKPASRETLIGWLKANTTGDARLRAGLPKTWSIGDKTGTASDTGTANDIAVAWPPNRKPIFAAVFLTAAKVSPEEQSAAVAAVGRVLAERISS